MYHEKVRLDEPSRTLKEQCIQHICSNIHLFANFENFTLLPEVTKQDILDSLAKTQSVTLPILSLFKGTPISHLNLSSCGRVTSQWCTTLRDFPLTQLNLSHCLITDESLNIMKTKTIQKKIKSDKSDKVQKSVTKKKDKGKARKGDQEPIKSSSPTQRSTPIKIEHEISKNLSNLNMSYIGQLSTDGIDVLVTSFTHLKMLSLEGCPRINNDTLISIGRMTQLTALNIKGCQKVTNKGITEIKRLGQMEVLNIGNLPKVSSESLKEVLPHLEKLVYLNISSNEKLDSMDSIQDLIFLRTLDISNLNLTNIEFLKRNTCITSINLSRTSIEDKDLLMLKDLENLKNLDLSYCKLLTSKGMSDAFQELGSLLDIDLSYTRCTSEVMKILSKFPLVCLNLRGCEQFYDAGFEYIGSISTLTQLNVSLLKTITEGWKFLRGDYKMLDIGGCIVQQNVEYFYELLEYSSRIEALYLTSNYIDDKIMKFVSKMSLKWLDLSHTSVTSDQIKFLWNMTTLETLSLRDCLQLKGNDFELLSRYFRLIFLDVSNTLIADDDLAYLVKCEDLCNLSLMNCKHVSDLGLKHLLKLPRLNSLNLYQVALSDGGMKTLRNLSNISILRLSLWDLISDQGFDMLHEIPNLVYLKTNILELNKTPGSYQV